MKFFGKKSEYFKVGKIRKYDEELMCFFSKTKRFHLFKSLLYTYENAENIPVVAGRVLLFYFVNFHFDALILEKKFSLPLKKSKRQNERISNCIG